MHNTASLDLVTLLGLAVALAMDALAVALATGLALPVMTKRHLFRLGWHFGLFQALMPILGWLAGLTVQKWIAAFDHWLAFGLLVFVGVRMLREAGQDNASSGPADPTRGWSLILLSVATSIDALAVGLSLAMLGIPIWWPALVIGLVAAALTVTGMLLGRRLAHQWGGWVEKMGGLVLIGIGLKILWQHLGA